jgi:hypothetical protein
MYDIEWHLFSSGFESENIISVMGVLAPDLVYFNSSITQGNHNLRPDKKKSTRFKTGENATKAQKQLELQYCFCGNATWHHQDGPPLLIQRTDHQRVRTIVFERLRRAVRKLVMQIPAFVFNVSSRSRVLCVDRCNEQ